jgi:DNA-binding NarL/FixJ family response regulator
MSVNVLDRGDLTYRETEVLEHIAMGLSDKGIARALDISTDTVVSHCRALYKKMEVDRQQGNVRCLVVFRAIAKGVIAISQ